MERIWLIGCYNVVNGDKETKEFLVLHEKVDGLAFIGSTRWPAAKESKNARS